MAITMMVNGVDISMHNARFFRMTPGRRNVSNASEMLDGGMLPFLSRPSFGIREFVFEMHVYGSSRDAISKNCGSILNLFGVVSTVDISGFIDSKNVTRHFKVSVSGADQTEYGGLKNRWSTLKLTCVGYEYGDPAGATLLHMTANTFDSYTSGNIGVIRRTISAESSAVLPYCGSPVPVTISIEHYPKRTITNDSFFSGVVGKEYPIFADFEIYGLCKNSVGKDLGPVKIKARPNTGTYKGSGITFLQIDGHSGNAKREYNGPVEVDVFEIDMPGPIALSNDTQSITTVINAYETTEFYHAYSVSISYNPVYL